MKDFVGTVVSGAIGLAALYVVGKIAFKAGHDIAEVEFRYEQLQKASAKKEDENAEKNDAEEENFISESTMEEKLPAKKNSKIRKLFGLGQLVRNMKHSAISDLLQDPDNHVIEASVRGREIHVNVKPRTA